MYTYFMFSLILGENRKVRAIFQHSVGKLISFHSYQFMKGLILVILSGCFPVFSWFTETAIAYWKCLLLFFLFIVYFLFFIHSLETAVSTKVETYDTCRIIKWQRIVALGIHLVFFSAILWWSKWWIFCLADVLGCLSYHVDMV